MNTLGITARGDHSYRGGAAALVIWLMLQLIALLLAAMQVRLWARVTPPVANHALWMMLAIQAGASALLFPWLMNNVRSAAVAIIVAVPLVQLAGMLGGQSGETLFRAGLGMVLWLGGLGLWARVLPSRRWQMVGIALASGLAIGGAVANYLAMDFGSAASWIAAPFIWLALGANLLCSACVAWVVQGRQVTGFPPEVIHISTRTDVESDHID